MLNISGLLLSGVDYMSDLVAIGMRTIYLLLLFTPSLLTCPLLLVNNKYKPIADLWWGLTRYFICLTGPCGIKL